jgi:hypothetical protein
MHKPIRNVIWNWLSELNLSKFISKQVAKGSKDFAKEFLKTEFLKI